MNDRKNELSNVFGVRKARNFTVIQDNWQMHFNKLKNQA
jgi:hypothetical protein